MALKSWYPFRRLLPDEHPTRRDMVLGRLWLMRNGIPSQAMDTLAAGPFLAACAISLGASNLLIGFVAAVPHLVQLIQMVGVYLVERYHARRLTAVIAASLARVMYLPMIAAMFVPSAETALGLLLIGVTLRYLFGAVTTAAWNAWIPDLVPVERRSEFFARRLRIMALVGTVLSLAAAALVDGWSAWMPERGERYAYAVMFAAAFGSGLYSVYCMTKMPDPAVRGKRTPFAPLSLFSKSFGHTNFRRLMLFLGTWNFATNLAAPFFMVYMLRRLGLELSLVTIFMILGHFAHVMVIRTWGHIADRYSNKSVLAVCGPLFVACIFAWTFTTFPERHLFTIPLLIAIHVLSGIATAGVTLASTAIGMKLAPKEEVAGFLATSSMVSAGAATLAPIVGGLSFADFFVTRELALVVHWTSPSGARNIPALFVSQWDFFFLLATAIGLYALHRLSLVREKGEVEEGIVIHEALAETRRAIRAISTIAGLKSLSEVPFDLAMRYLRSGRGRRGRPSQRRDRRQEDQAPGPEPD